MRRSRLLPCLMRNGPRRERGPRLTDVQGRCDDVMTLLQKGVYQTRTNTPDAPVTMAVFLSDITNPLFDLH